MELPLIIYDPIADKLWEEHGLEVEEVEEIWRKARPAYTLTDDDEEHATDPETQWFVEKVENAYLKIIFVEHELSGMDGITRTLAFLKSAYVIEKNSEDLKIWKSKKAKVVTRG